MVRESFVGHIRSWTMDQSHYYWWHVAILLHGSKHHCTTEKSARQPSLPASQLRILLQYTSHHTSNIKIQPMSKRSSPISTSNTPPSRRSHHSSIINQSIRSKYGSMGVMVRDLEWRGRHFLLFLWVIVMDLISALRMSSRCGLILLRRRVFRAFVAYLLNQAVNPTHVPFIS